MMDDDNGEGETYCNDMLDIAKVFSTVKYPNRDLRLGKDPICAFM